MIAEHVLIGGVTVFLCLMFLTRETWILGNSHYGLRLVHWFGPENARWVLRGLICLGIIVGILIATRVLRPIQW